MVKSAAITAQDTSNASTRSATRYVTSVATEGFGLGVNGTPTVFINGRPLTGSQTYDAYVAVIDEELAASN
jgi:protein-disulfide isomerase